MRSVFLLIEDLTREVISKFYLWWFFIFSGLGWCEGDFDYLFLVDLLVTEYWVFPNVAGGLLALATQAAVFRKGI